MTSLQAAFAQPQSVSVSDSLLISIFFATVVHAAILLSISFTAPQPPKITKSIAITIVNTNTQKVPKKAKFLAQNNQQASGKTREKPAPPMQQLSGQHINTRKGSAGNESKQKPTPSKKTITQPKPDKKQHEEQKSTTSVKQNRPQLSTDAIVKQIARLGAQIRYNQQNSEQSRIKFVNSVSAHKFIAAQYILDWQNKVERTGNLNYPEAARKKHFTGSLVMDVGIKHDGSVYSIRINKSSGEKALDDAAKRIVHMSAPFSPLPIELRKELDVLVITRIWQFSDEAGMSTR